MIPKILTEISNYLSEQRISLSKQFDDGRINASMKIFSIVVGLSYAEIYFNFKKYFPEYV